MPDKKKSKEEALRLLRLRALNNPIKQKAQEDKSDRTPSYKQTFDRAAQTRTNTRGQSSEDKRRTYTKPTTPTIAERTWDTLKGAGKQFVGGHMANIGTAAQFAEPTARGIQKTDYREPSKEYSLRSREEAERRENERSRDIALKEGRDLRTFKGRDYSGQNPYLQDYINRADQLIISGGEDIERAKEGAGKLGKLAVDVGANAAQMAGDALTNMAFPGLGMLSLASRASGTASYEARQDGMGVNEQFLYGQGTGLIEALSEGIFNSVSAFHAAYGKGAFSLADKLNMRSAASKIVQDYIKTEGGKALVNNLSRLGAGMLEEGIEEIVAGLAEPALKYVLQKSSDPMAKWEGYDWAELGYDFLVGALMGGLGGAASLPGQVMGDVALKSQAMMDGNDYAQSLVDMARVQGREGARTSDAEILAEQLQGQIDQGLTIQPSQARMLQRAIGESRQTNEQAFNERATQQYQKAVDEGRAAKVQSRGTMEEAIGFNRRVTEDLKDNIEVARLTMGEDSSRASQEAVGRYITGEADTVDIDTILSDKDAKKAVEELTGLKLSMKNTEARTQLEDRTVLNRMENRDRLLAKTHEDIRTNMNARGGEVFKANYDEAVKTIGTRNAPEIYESIYSRFYTDGTVEGSSFKESYDRIVKPLTEDFGEELGSKIQAVFTKDFAQKVFMAGQTALAEVRAKGTTTEISKKAASAPSGFTYESSARAKITDRQADLLQRFAEKANVHIRLVNSIAGGAANGQYDPNTGVIMIAADSDNKLITVAKHELTHHLKATSPARYQELEDFVIKEWYKNDPEAFEDKISEYQHRYRDITAEEAREELIADSSEAFFTDKAAISHAVSFSEKLGRALHRGIKDLLSTFVDLQEGDNRAYKGYGDFMDDIGVLRKAEKMWLDALEDSAGRGNASSSKGNLESGSAKSSLKDSNGNSLTKAQAEFFKDSKARDENGNLLVLYHGTDSAGFNTFRLGSMFKGIFFTSSRRTANAYAANWEDKLYDPNERETREKITTGSYTEDYLQEAFRDFRFDTKEDLEKFKRDHPGIENVKSEGELLRMLDDEEITEDEYDDLRKFARRVEKDYARYELEHMGPATWQDILDNPDAYGFNDVKRALMAYDREISIDEGYEPDTKEDLLDAMRYILEEDAENRGEGETPLNELEFNTRLPIGSESEYVRSIDNRTYESYVNLKNPMIIDAKGRAMSDGYYGYLEDALADDKYDGFIVKNVILGAYRDQSTVVVAKDPGQIKLTSNQNPTQDKDIRYSLKTEENQEFTSADTSINSSKVPAVFNKVKWKSGTVNVDIGGGRFDTAQEFLKPKGVENLVYDPYNRSAKHNKMVSDRLDKNKADTATISNVLNVIQEKGARLEVLNNAKENVKPGGEVYITVYEGNGSGVGGQTTKGYQLNMKLADYLKEVQEVFPDAYIRKGMIIAPNNQAAEPIKAKQQRALNSSGIAEAKDGTVAKYSLKSWLETDKKKKLQALIDAGHGKKAASKWIDDISSIASIILSDQTRLDYVADRRYKAIKPNGDYYKKTFDNSTLCDKRRLYQGTYNAIQKALPQLPLTEDLVIEIRDMLNKKGLESPCGICYVESMRKNLGRYAKDWYDTYARKDEITLADVTTSDGFVNLRKTKPEIAEAFEKAMNAKGVSSPKVVQLRTDYREEIMRMPQSTVDYLNKIGGLRFHSFSDFETPHLIDTMQAIMDMAAKKLAGMAYTKVVNFPAVFGGTGMKINLSLIIKTDENGNAVYEDYTDENGETKKRLVFDSKEGIDYEEASKWRDKYPDDVAFIVVGKDKQTTLDAIADPRIDYVIPFHRSKWSQENLEKLGLKGYVDFATGHQDNKILLDEYWNYNKSGKENAEAYLKKCAEKGVKPVFEQLLVDNGNGSYSLQKDGSTDNYWKLLIEGKMYNHLTKKGVKQKPVVPNFDMEEARRVLNEYKGGANDLPVAEGVVKEFVEKHKKDKYSLKDRTPFYEREGYESSYQIAKRQQGEMREGREKQRRIGQIADIHKRLTDKLFKPTDDKHLPDGYAPAVEDVLSRFNFTTEGMEKWAAKNGRRSKSMNSMNNLQRILRRMAEAEGGEIAVDADLLPIVEDLTDILGDGEVKLSDLSSTELANIKRLFSAFEHQINSYNKMFVEGKKETAAQSAARTFEEMAKDNKWKLGIMGRVFNGKGTTNFNPSDFFELIGGEIYDLYQGARTGFDRYVRNTDNAKTFIQNTVNNKVADRWANKTRTYTTSSGDEITLTDAQLMGLYCLSKREQAQEHIYIGGVISAPVKVKKKLTTRELEEKRVVPTQEDILSWVSKLSAEQREVADKIQNYLSTVPSEWGNETSMIMYGYKKFNEKMYYPIQSSQDYLDSTFDQAAGDPTLRNIGPSKAVTKGANNAIVVDDIFTVFSKHIAQMASYNAYVPAIADFQRVWNFNDRENGRKVKARFKEAYGRDAYNYVDDFFKSLNGVYKNGFEGGGVLNWAGSMFKKAAVGGNVRVLVQQPTAIARAALLINPAYLTAAIPMATAHPKRTYQEMMDHVPIAKWKAWGFYSTDVSSASKNLRDIMIGSEAISDKVFMDMYGAADNMTWTAIFKACQLQVEAQNKGLKKGSDEYWDKVSKLASRVFDRTQVVDSPFHRSNLMKSKDTGTKMATAFMAEPTKTVNMLNTEITLAARELRAKHPGKAIALLTRVGMVFTANAALLACGQALVDAMRHTGGDDDKDKGKYGDRWAAYWKDNFVKNLEVIGMIPILKDVQSVWEGYDVTRMDMQGIKRVVQSTQYLKKYLEDPANSKYTGYEEWSNVAFAIAYTMGVPIANVKRDFEALVLTGAEAANDPNVALFFMKNKYQVNSKTKSLWIDYYLDSIEKGNEGLARNVKKYITSNGVITEEDIQKKANDRHRANPSEEEKARIKQSMDTLGKSDAWKNADPDDRERYTNIIEKYDLGIEDSQTDSVKKYAEENNLSFEDAITSKLADKQKDAEETEAIDKSMAKISKDSEWQELNEKQQKYYKDVLNEIIRGTESGRADAVKSQVTSKKTVEDVIIEGVHKGNEYIDNVSSTDIWKEATDDQKSQMETVLRKVGLGISDTQTTPYTKYEGLSPEQVALYKLALKKADERNNGNKSYDSDEKRAALEMLRKNYKISQEQENTLLGKTN